MTTEALTRLPTSESRLSAALDRVASRGGRFWVTAGMVSLVVHATLPSLTPGRAVVEDDRVSITFFTAPSPAEEPAEAAPTETPIVDDEPASDETEPPTPDEPVADATPPVEAPSVEPPSVEPPSVEPPSVEPPSVDDEAPSAEPTGEEPPPAPPAVDEAAPVVDETVPVVETERASEPEPKKLVRLPRLERERGVPVRAVRPRATPRKAKPRVASKSARGTRDGSGRGEPPAALKSGEPDDVWACEADGRGIIAQVRKERPITDWVTLLPSALFAYPTTPSLTDYLGGVSQVTSRKRRHVPRVGRFEFAMPRGEIEVALTEPLGVRAFLGRNDARCLVGFESTKDGFFPMTLRRVPVRVVDAEGHEETLLVDLRFHKDARFELVPRADDEHVPFEDGRLENAALIERTIDAHMGTAKTLASVASFFGFDVDKMVAAEQKRRLKAANERAARAASVSARPADRR